LNKNFKKNFKKNLILEENNMYFYAIK